MEEQFLYLDTTGWKTRRKHKIEIWFVEHDGKHYIMAEGGEHTHWVQNVRRNPKASFSVGGKTFSGVGKVIEDGPIASEVKKLMKQKYRWDSGLIVELSSS